MTLLTLDFPLSIQRSRLAWAAQLNDTSNHDGRTLTPALMHSASRDALLLLPHHHPLPDQLWARITPQDARSWILARPDMRTIQQLGQGLRAVLDAHEPLRVTPANRAIVGAAHAARVHLLWLCETPAAAALAAQDALSLTPQDRRAREIARRVRLGIQPRWRIALDALGLAGDVPTGARRAS